MWYVFCSIQRNFTIVAHSLPQIRVAVFSVSRRKEKTRRSKEGAAAVKLKVRRKIFRRKFMCARRAVFIEERNCKNCIVQSVKVLEYHFTFKNLLQFPLL